MLPFPALRPGVLSALGLVLLGGCYRSFTLPGEPSDAGPPPILDAAVDGDGGPVACPDPDAFDSDGDGIGDAQELALGLDPCRRDSDGDGQRDLDELGRHVAACPDLPFDPENPCEPPGEFLLIRLVSGEPSRLIGITHDATTRDVDVLVLRGLRDSEAAAAVRPYGVALAAWQGDLGEGFDSVWLGAAGYRDFPFFDFGARETDDTVLMQFAEVGAFESAAAWGEALEAALATGSGDAADAATEAVYRTITGAGELWVASDGPPLRLFDFASTCEPGRFGAPCFREQAQTVVVFAPQTCAHEGPPGDDDACTRYGNAMMPPATTWSEMVGELERRDVRVVGVRDAERTCDLARPEPGTEPCFLIDALARASGSVRRDGSPLAIAFSGDDDADRDALVAAVRDAVREVRFDVRGAVAPFATPAFDPGDTVVVFEPTCATEGPSARCWRPRDGVLPFDAVEGVGPGGFEGVLDGTQLDFWLELQALEADASPLARAGRLDLRFFRGDDRLRDEVTVVIVVEATPPD